MNMYNICVCHFIFHLQFCCSWNFLDKLFWIKLSHLVLTVTLKQFIQLFLFSFVILPWLYSIHFITNRANENNFANWCWQREGGILQFYYQVPLNKRDTIAPAAYFLWEDFQGHRWNWRGVRCKYLRYTRQCKEDTAVFYCTDTGPVWPKAIADSCRTFLPHKAHKPWQQVQHLRPRGPSVNNRIQTPSPALGIDIC